MWKTQKINLFKFFALCFVISTQTLDNCHVCTIIYSRSAYDSANAICTECTTNLWNFAVAVIVFFVRGKKFNNNFGIYNQIKYSVQMQSTNYQTIILIENFVHKFAFNLRFA